MTTSLAVAVGPAGTISTSSDGLTWTARTSGTTRDLNAVAFGGGLWVAVGGNATSNTQVLLTSPDGVTWTTRTPHTAHAGLNDVAYGNGVWVAVGASGDTYHSTDGITWTFVSSGTTTFASVVWNGTKFFAFTSSSTTPAVSSTDGTSWTSVGGSGGTIATDGDDVAWTGTKFVNNLTGAGGGNVKVSTDAITWSNGGDPLLTSQSGAIYLAYPGVLVVLGRSGGAGAVATSTDSGTTFSAAHAITGTTGAPTSLTHNGAVYIGVWNDGTLRTSPDLVTWTARTSQFGATAINDVSIRPNVAPNAPTLTAPPSGNRIDRTLTQRFSWTFSDNDAGDSQSKFDLQYRLVGAGSWTTVTSSTPNAFYDFSASAFPAGDYEWQVRTYDSQGVVGPWSSSSFFTATVPTPLTIMAPASGSSIPNGSANVLWSTPDQDVYQIRKVADNAGSPDTSTVYYDSGAVNDSGTRQVTLAFPTNNRYEHVQVRAQKAGLWSAWTSVRVHVAFTPPAEPDLSVVPSQATASILLTFSQPTPTDSQPVVASAEVWRNDGSGSIRVAKDLPPDGDWTDYTPASGVDYTYRLVAVGSSGATSSTEETGGAGLYPGGSMFPALTTFPGA